MESEPGRCPACGAVDLNYDEGPLHDGVALWYVWTCGTCQADGTEEYSVKFVQHEIRHNGNNYKGVDA
jgi:hypothetical protein